MTIKKAFGNSIPISLALEDNQEKEKLSQNQFHSKKRLFTIASLAVLVAACISIIAKGLVYLINLITNISFYGSFSFHHSSPADNTLGLWVIFIPFIGGLIVGLMALYGSKAIRGHGIPEAMEQILTNQSKIKPTITYLKPISSAISIGSGGPFGAEGPIIATGGALGSTLGQLMRITDNERKILLAAGATAGMSAIFGSPVAAIFLAIELLLFEFSPRSFIPVALACITGAAGHHFLFEHDPVFKIEGILEAPSNTALFFYSLLGILIGAISVLVTKIVYWVEDGFEKLPIHWAWWPAIGGLVVGLVGYFAPKTLGVGYDNITQVLTGNTAMPILISLCIFKFISWAIALGSGTSGGTLAPLLTIGGAFGAIIGTFILQWFPQSGIVVSMAALIGMSAMFAGASRAFLTSIVFALETTGQTNALLPLLAACTAAYFVSYFIMENTIMTEKMARRGVAAPESFEPDSLEKLKVEDVYKKDYYIINENITIEKAISDLSELKADAPEFFMVSNEQGEFIGLLSSSDLHKMHPQTLPISHWFTGDSIVVKTSDNLKTIAGIMARQKVDSLAVSSHENQEIIGVISYKDILKTYRKGLEEHLKKNPHVSLKRQGLKMVVHGKQLGALLKRKDKQ